MLQSLLHWCCRVCSVVALQRLQRRHAAATTLAAALRIMQHFSSSRGVGKCIVHGAAFFSKPRCCHCVARSCGSIFLVQRRQLCCKSCCSFSRGKMEGKKTKTINLCGIAIGIWGATTMFSVPQLCILYHGIFSCHGVFFFLPWLFSGCSIGDFLVHECSPLIRSDCQMCCESCCGFCRSEATNLQCLSTNVLRLFTSFLWGRGDKGKNQKTINLCDIFVGVWGVAAMFFVPWLCVSFCGISAHSQLCGTLCHGVCLLTVVFPPPGCSTGDCIARDAAAFFVLAKFPQHLPTALHVVLQYFEF